MNQVSTEDLSKRQIQIYDSIVAHIQEYGFAPTVRELCKLTGLASTSTIIGHLKTLEKKGYIKRVSVKDDKRLKKIILTGTGKLIQEKVHSLIQEGEQKLKDELTEEELKIFMDILLRLSKKLG